MAGYSPTLTISSRKARNTPAHSRTPHRKADRQTHAHKHPPRPAARHDPMAPPGEATAHAPRRSGRDGERVEANDLFLLRREERGPALPYPTLPGAPHPPTNPWRGARAQRRHSPPKLSPARARAAPARSPAPRLLPPSANGRDPAGVGDWPAGQGRRGKV